MSLHQKHFQVKRMSHQNKKPANRTKSNSQHNRLYSSIKLHYKNPPKLNLSSSIGLTKNIKQPINSLLCSIDEKLRAAALKKNHDQGKSPANSPKNNSKSPVRKKAIPVAPTPKPAISSKKLIVQPTLTKSVAVTVSQARPNNSKKSVQNKKIKSLNHGNTKPLHNKTGTIVQNIQKNARRWLTPKEKEDRIKELVRQKEILLGILEEHERIKRDRQCVSLEIQHMKQYIDGIGKKLDGTLQTLAKRREMCDQFEEIALADISPTQSELIRKLHATNKTKLRKICVDSKLMNEYYEPVEITKTAKKKS